MYKYVFIINYVYMYNWIKSDFIYFKLIIHLKLESLFIYYIILINKNKYYYNK